MRKIKSGYYYFFYKLYNFWEEISVPSYWSDWKASLSLDVLVFFLIFSMMVYYNVFFDRYFNFGDKKIFIIFFILIVSIPNFFIFNYNDTWKEYNLKFSKYPKRKNSIGGFLVWAVILGIIFNLILSLYLMSKVDWKQYR